MCHTVIAEKSKHSPDHLAYNASSPDELALVNAAKYFGYSFKGRDEENNVLVELKGSPAEDLAMSSPVKKYRLLNVVEFTSTRKRMTVIVRSLQPEDEGAIRVMCKGADSIIIPRLRKGAKHGETLEKSKAYLEEFSKEGLRTLVIAEKRISDDEYHMWNKEYQNALIQTKGREEKVNQAAELIEQDFDLVGTTAIEDKLQDDVSPTLEFIKAAGIKVWVLTGDKIETAVNIGISCNLLNIEMETFVIDAVATKHIMLQIT